MVFRPNLCNISRNTLTQKSFWTNISGVLRSFLRIRWGSLSLRRFFMTSTKLFNQNVWNHFKECFNTEIFRNSVLPLGPGMGGEPFLSRGGAGKGSKFAGLGGAGKPTALPSGRGAYPCLGPLWKWLRLQKSSLVFRADSPGEAADWVAAVSQAIRFPPHHRHHLI